MTTDDFGGDLGRPFDTFICNGLSQFHGHRSWLVSEVAQINQIECMRDDENSQDGSAQLLNRSQSVVTKQGTLKIPSATKGKGPKHDIFPMSPLRCVAALQFLPEFCKLPNRSQLGIPVIK